MPQNAPTMPFVLLEGDAAKGLFWQNLYYQPSRRYFRTRLTLIWRLRLYWMLSTIGAIFVLCFLELMSLVEFLGNIVALEEAPGDGSALDDVPFLFRQVQRHNGRYDI